MKISYKILVAVFVLTFLCSFTGSPIVIAATTPSLGAAETYGILANSYTNPVPGTTINGDIGFTNAPAIVPGGTRANYGSGGLYTAAGVDRSSALADLNSQPCTFTFAPGIINLATDTTHGQMGVYTPGVYCVSSMAPMASIGASGITLSGSGTYIFRINGSLVTAANSVVALENGASACNVFWTPADNAITSSLGANSTFVGTLIGTVRLVMYTNVSWIGRALLFDGTVVTDVDDTITVPSSCNPPPQTATLHVVKHVINNDGGVATASSFTLHVKSSGSMGGSVDVVGSPTAGAETPGIPYTLAAGTYAVSEEAFSGYTQSFSGDCDSSGNIILTSGTDKTCMITNDDILLPPISVSATLHVIKHVINNNGGSATASSFNLHVKTAGSMGGNVDVVGSPASGIESGRAYGLTAGSYIVSEETFSGYTQSISGDCDVSGNIILTSGIDRTCTITNDDIAPPQLLSATLHVIKHVINNDSGTATASSFTLHVKSAGSMGGSVDVVGSPTAGVETPGTPYTLVAGTYAVSEEAFSGYTQSFSGDCDSSGTITLASGADKTCMITNDDVAVKIPPPPSNPKSATLHVIKIVINDNGGKAVPSSAVVHVTSGTGDVAGSPHAGASSPGTPYALNAGAYTVSEDFFAGYKVAIGGDCSASGAIVLASGDDKTCTITNNDIAGVQPPVTPPNPPTVNPPSKPECDICARLTYDVYIINPDGTQRHTGTPWVKVTERGNGITRYSFEDATIDPKNPLFDHNDSVIDVDLKDCKSVKFMFVSSDASWKHQVRIKVSIDGVMQSDALVANDSKAVVGTSKTINAVTGVNTSRACLSTPSSMSGKILLQVQAHGEAWYVRPESGLRYYMKDGSTAYSMMRNFGGGITDVNLKAIPSVATVDELKKTTSACLSGSTANKVKGKILLQVQQHGEAWYVDPVKCRRIYLKNGEAAYTLMRFLGLGITDVNLEKIKIGR